MARIGADKTYGKSKKKAAVEDTADELQDSAEEEYEVEDILNHSRSGKTLEYQVSWVGYEGELTWIPEEDADGMRELVDKYWSEKVKPNKRHERYPPGSKQALAAKKEAEQDKRRSLNGGGGDSKPNSSASKKAQNKSAAASSSSTKKRTIEDEDDEDGLVTGSGKKQKPMAATKKHKREDSPQLVTIAKSSKKAGADETSESADSADSEEEDDDVDGYLTGREVTDLDKVYKSKTSWEDLVEKVETIQQAATNQLRFLIVWKENDAASWVASDIVRRKCPQKVIDFYETHLKFTQMDP
ncbi:hypothetical protein ACM66B_001991 [Microbotryomycetes sp. NB124-2]